MDEDKKKAYAKAYYEANKEKWYEKAKKHRMSNREEYNRKQSEYHKKTNYKHAKTTREKNKELVNSIKRENGCMNPGCKWEGTLEPCCLDFHHIDDSDKTYVSQMLALSESRIRQEISKCTLLCAVCHRLATFTGLDCSGFNRCAVESEMSPEG